MTLTRRAARLGVRESMRIYLGTGDCRSGPADLAVYQLAGSVLHGRLAGLRAAWERHGHEIMRDWPARGPRPFAARALALADGDWRGVLAILETRR